ncbi:hypothetical protein HOD29_06130 [archaeon]|jgi:hypothetical protein|nr:hypothetical protein [archaeon]
MKTIAYIAIVIAAILIAFFIFISLSNKEITGNSIDDGVSCSEDGCPLHDLEPLPEENSSRENKLNQLDLIE